MSIKTYHASTKKLEQLAGNVNPSDIEKLKNDVVQLSDEKANNGSSAYDSSKSYSVGEHCIHNGKLWMCKVACSGVEPTEGTYWTEVTMASLNYKFLYSLDNTKLYRGFLTCNENGVLPFTQGNIPGQLTLTLRNQSTGSIVTVWYDGSIKAFRVANGTITNGQRAYAQFFYTLN